MDDIPNAAPSQPGLTTPLSEEPNALDRLESNPIAPPAPRRVRRRRRSMRRRLFDSILPFAILVGLTIFAVGLVRIVEIGAAGESKTSSVPTRPELERTEQPSFDFSLAQADYEELMRQQDPSGSRTSKMQNQVAYQLSLQIEAQRDLSLSNGFPKSASANDVMDWALFEKHGSSPSSALKRGAVRPVPKATDNVTR